MKEAAPVYRGNCSGGCAIVGQKTSAKHEPILQHEGARGKVEEMQLRTFLGQLFYFFRGFRDCC